MKIRKLTDQLKRVRLKIKGISRTKQQDAADLNVTEIMRKYDKTKVLPLIGTRKPIYGDFSSPMEFADAFSIVTKANEQFLSLPAKVRERFGHDPKAFLEFVKPENAKELFELGIIKRDEYEASLDTVAKDSDGKVIFESDGKPKIIKGKPLVF